MSTDVQKSKEIKAYKEKRDMFAAAALTGVVTAFSQSESPKGRGYEKEIAQASYKIADAMMAER